MRDLNNSNTMRINCSISGEVVEFQYRTPTTAELTSYASGQFKRKRNKFINNSIVCRIDHALKIITGFREGDFGINGKPISSNPDSACFREDWRDLLKKQAPDLLAVFAFSVFEGSGSDPLDLENPEDGEEEDDDSVPLA